MLMYIITTKTIKQLFDADKGEGSWRLGIAT